MVVSKGVTTLTAGLWAESEWRVGCWQVSGLSEERRGGCAVALVAGSLAASAPAGVWRASAGAGAAAAVAIAAFAVLLPAGAAASSFVAVVEGCDHSC